MASKATILEDISESRKSDVRQRVRQSSSSSTSIRDPLSIDNYKEKFTQLIEAEREGCRGFLKQRCKGKFEYHFSGSTCPEGAIMKSYCDYKIYGILKGLENEDFAYVKEHASSVTLTCESFQADADLLYSKQNGYQLILAFPDDHSRFRDTCDVSVIFQLKEHYFDDLLHSLENLNIIPRLIPTSFEPISHEENLSSCEDFCSAEQFDALKVIVNSSPSGPPVLLTGAVGTRKSQLLAISALYFLTKSLQASTRILVCTQQQFSADKFLKYYITRYWPGKNNDIVFVIPESRYSSIDSTKRKYYKSIEELEIDPKIDKLLLITTCLKAPHLKKYLPVGFFSHIFIDEASHMREPEAVAPLCYANDKTKIVIAGDTNQVGPANSVRGYEARANSLHVSLLQRLEKHYNLWDNCQLIAKLTHCNRCHPEILDLVSNLFYKSSLKWDEEEAKPGTHHKHPYPLVFICSGVDKLCDPDFELEAEIIVEKVFELAKRPPRTWNTSEPMKNYLITTPYEKQVNIISSKFKSKGHDEFPDIKTVFQGQEYQAVILSTSEPVNQDGSTRDSTKSFCDPYVFNTVITRAKSLVVAVGNPFLLFGMEKDFVRKYGNEHNAHCWSTYLNLCIENNSFYFDERLSVTTERKSEIIEKIQAEILEVQKFKILEEENKMLKQQLQEQKREHKKEVLLLQQQIAQLMQQVAMQQSLSHHLPLPDPTVTVSETTQPSGGDYVKGKGMEETPTKGGSKMIAHLDYQHVFVHKQSIEHENRTFLKKNILGEGGFAKVYHVTEQGQNENYALKVIKCDRVSEKILREVKVLQSLDHWRIVRYVNHWVRDDDQGWWNRKKDESRGNHQYLFILTELCREDTLYHWLKKMSGKSCRPTNQVTSYFGQILEGLIFIHGNEYVHRDLKPSNIFFSRANDELKIGDFGLVMDESSHNVIVSQNMDSNNTESTFEGCGTPIYMSPEQKNKEHVDSKTDIFALGIILFELFYPKKMSSKERLQVLKSLTQKNFPKCFIDYFPKVFNLIIQMTEQESSQRPTARTVQATFNQIEEVSQFIPVCDEEKTEQE